MTDIQLGNSRVDKCLQNLTEKAERKKISLFGAILNKEVLWMGWWGGRVNQFRYTEYVLF